MKEGLVVRTSATGESQNGIRIGFVGAGKVGFSMGKFFALGGLNVSGYFSRSVQSAREAADFTGSSCFESLGELVAASDAVFITVPDGAITRVYEQLCAYDLTMIEWAEIGVAMGNAVDEVKAKADYVTLDNNSDDIAFALERLVPELLA